MNCSFLYHPFLHPFPPTQNSKIDACVELCLFHTVFSDHSSTSLRPVGFLDFFPLYLTGFGDFWWERKHTIKGQCGRTVVSWSKRSDFLQEMRTFEMHFCFGLLSIQWLRLSTWHLLKIHWGYFCTIDFEQTSGAHVVEHSQGMLTVWSPGHSRWPVAISFLSKYTGTAYVILVSKVFPGHLIVSGMVHMGAG